MSVSDNMSTTYNSTVTDSPVVPSPDALSPPPQARLLTREEQESILSADLEDMPAPGKVMFASIDEDGTPTGPVLMQQPLTEPFVPVQAVSPAEPPVLLTPTGAPITDKMNPGINFYDAGLAERNPIPLAEDKEAAVQRQAEEAEPTVEPAAA